jgi:hypothetical protein
MKHKLLSCVILLLVLLCGCTMLPDAMVSHTPAPLAQTTPSAAVVATATPTPTATVHPTPAAILTPTPSPLETPFAYRQPSEDTVIISNVWGDVLGGYSEGHWLSHSGAAAYCGSPMTFTATNLAGSVYTTESSGVSYPEETYENYVFSWAKGMGEDEYDEHGYYELLIEEPEMDFNYDIDPLCSAYLYYGGSQPEVEVIEDTSDILLVIQEMVDEHFGEDVVEAKVRVAVSADIDGDGGEEIIVNADNDAMECLDIMGDQKLYSIALLIESDGSVCVIAEYYSADSQMDQWSGKFMYVQNVIDLNGDGRCEIVLDYKAWETWETLVFEYSGKQLTEVLEYGTGN